MSINKCDVCSKFGELEEVTITIKKHNNCDVNAVFGQSPASHIIPVGVPTATVGGVSMPDLTRSEKQAKILEELNNTVPATNTIIGQ